MPNPITRYLGLLDEQREAIFDELGPLPDAVLWYRPGPRVWSIGEHLDHTRVHNCWSRRLGIVYVPPASVFAWPFRRRPYNADMDDPCGRPDYPNWMGRIIPPKYTPRRPVGVGVLHEALRTEHAAQRRFYTARDERIFGHILVADLYLGVFNTVQWLRYLTYHDAHHYERVRVRIKDPAYARAAAAAAGNLGARAGRLTSMEK